MSGLELDFIVYLGDPDEGAEALTSTATLNDAEQHKDHLQFPDVYGAVTVTKGGKALVDPKPDPIFSMVTNLVKAIPYVIDGEPETVLLSESEFGFSFEPSGDDVLVSVFAGDQYEPDEFLLQESAMPLEKYGEQVLKMGEQLRDIIKKVTPDAFEDDYMKGLVELLDVGKDAFKNFKLQKEHGLRR